VPAYEENTMTQLTLPQMRGIKDLAQTAINEAVSAIEAAHNEIARRPYAIMAWFPPIAGTARAVECVQGSITNSVYHSIRAANAMAGALATLALDVAEIRESSQTPEVERRDQA
jgi:hypothetical protein